MNPEYNVTNINNSAINVSSICVYAEHLSKNIYLNILLFFRVLLYIFGVVFNLVLIKIQGNHLAVHKNASLLLNNHHLTVILQCGCGILHAYNLITYRTFDNPCDLTLTFRACTLFRFIPTMAGLATVFSLALMVVERFWASYTYRTYERSSSAFGVWLILIEWTAAVGIVIWFVYDGPFEKSFFYCTMGNNANVRDRAATTQVLLSGSEIFAIFCYYGLLKWNKQRKSRLITASLTQKYQVDENIRAIRLMTPMLIMHVICLIPPIIIFSAYMLINQNLDPDNYPSFEESFVWSPIYCAGLPVVLFWYHRALRSSLWRILHPSLESHSDEGDAGGAAVAEQNFHFEALNLAWDSTPKTPSVRVELTLKQDTSEF